MAQNLKKHIVFVLFLSSFLHSCENEYQDLVQTYEQLEEKNFAAWYNIGILYKELGQQAKATCAFVRAQKQAGLFEFEKAGRHVCQMGNFEKVYGSAFYYYVYSIPLYCYQYFFLIWALIFLILWYGMIRYRRKKRYTYIIFCFLISIYGLYSIKYDCIYAPCAVIIDQQVDCFAGPDINFLVVGNVQGSEVYKIYKELNDFCQIKKNGAFCWVERKSLEKV